MIGVWDTVGSLGIPFGNIPGLSRRRFGFPNTRLSAIYEHAYHALALDEHRADLRRRSGRGSRRPIPTRPASAACGRRSSNSAGSPARMPMSAAGSPGDDMPQLPLARLMQKAGDLGLAYRGEVVPTGSEITAPIKDSFKSFLRGLYPRSASWDAVSTARIAAHPRPRTMKDLGSKVNKVIDGSASSSAGARSEPIARATLEAAGRPI